MRIKQLIDQLTAMADEHGDRNFTVHYSPSARTMEIAVVGVFDSDVNESIIPRSFELDITTNQD